MFSKDKKDKNYKFISLKTYAWDRSMNHKRKFRRVFDRHELNYLSVQLEFYNKLFDEDDWEIEITCKAFRLEGDKKVKELCTDTKTVKVLKDQNIISYDYGWGNDVYGKFWAQGDYQWEVYLDDEFLELAKFHIEDEGRVTAESNPYLKVVSIKTYEAPAGDIDEDKRVYLKQFSKKDTRYIMTELKFINKLENEWLCELLFNYYDDTGVLIGVADSLGYVTPNLGAGEIFPITQGWGTADGDSWIHDNYRVEVVFMDNVIAMIPFSVGDKEIVRLSEYEALINEDINGFYGKTSVGKKETVEVENTSSAEGEKGESETETETVTDESQIEIDNRPLSEILADLDKLVGLREIKNKVREYVDYVSFLQYREENGIKDDEEINLHSVFTGNPGTGKTTVVKLLGQIYRAMGLLSKGHVHTVESNDLISGYVRQTGKDTREVIEKARGGILFIDEAYMLYKDGAPNDFGPEAVAALITEMSDGPGDIAIMVAGYPKEMESFINSNPGLKSRFRNHYFFDDYTPDELVAIAKFAADEKDVVLSEAANAKLKKIVTEAFRKRDRTFGNARLVHSLVDEAKMNMGIRLVREYDVDELTREMLTTIEAVDVEDPALGKMTERLKLDVDTPLLEEALAELNMLTGLTAIKQEVHELIRLTKYYREMDRDLLKAFSMHSVFLGNPGTGKTTVARVMGKVYKALGLLERGHLIDADGGDLIAGWVGQTSGKTKDLIKRAMGGILFIDEAYAITEGGNTTSGGNDFGKKAIAALIKEMEDHRGEFGVIVAGYTDNMKNFIESNPGIKSRFDRTFEFQDFAEEELWEIALSMFSQRGLKPDKEATDHLKKYIAFLYATRNKFFGNARSIRKIIEKSYRNHELRMADLPREKRTDKVMSTIVLEDVLEFDPGKAPVNEKPGIGYRFGS